MRSAEASAWRVDVVVTPIVRMPAERAASRPATESSTATQADGGMPSRSAAVRYGLRGRLGRGDIVGGDDDRKAFEQARGAKDRNDFVVQRARGDAHRKAGRQLLDRGLRAGKQDVGRLEMASEQPPLRFDEGVAVVCRDAHAGVTREFADESVVVAADVPIEVGRLARASSRDRRIRLEMRRSAAARCRQ